MAAFKITVIEADQKRTRAFYMDMGPFFASREVSEELGEPMDDEEGTFWFLMYQDKKVVAWSALRIREDGIAVFDWTYVVPAMRQKGLWGRLHKAKLAFVKERELKAIRAGTRDEDLKETYKSLGWAHRHDKGAWSFYETIVGSPEEKR